MKMRYVELFSGIGAFTQAIHNILGNDAECVFAADNNRQCAEVYMDNYGLDSYFDLTKDDKTCIPDHDFCFFSPPCQAFSKSGKQLGFHEARGTLIYEVFKILEKHHPKYILMENVRNLSTHDNGNTYRVIVESLHELGYRIPQEPLILSPHQFGIPQTRERLFIPGIYDPGKAGVPLEIGFPPFKTKDDCSIDSIIDHSFDDDAPLKITEQEYKVLSAWDEFYKGIDLDVIGFPVWYSSFKSTDADTFGMPGWKADIIRKNRTLYSRNKEFIDRWSIEHDVDGFNDTQKKFEWQAGTRIGSVWDGIIQIRPSGYRVKAPTTAPALVAIVQTPIIGPLKRRLSVKECAALQSFPPDFDLSSVNEHDAYKQLGNSINVATLQKVIEVLLGCS